MKILIDDKIQDYTPEQIARWTDELPEWRRRRVLAYKHDAGRRQSLLAYRLLCQGLSEEYGIAEPPTFLYGEHGKPHLSLPRTGEDGEGPHFSLSHCREAVACIIDERPCGIDIESLGRRVSDSLIHYAMNEEEQSKIAHSIEKSRTFLHLWTQKEAVLKLIGTGIRDDMRNLLKNESFHLHTQEAERWIVSYATSAKEC